MPSQGTHTFSLNSKAPAKKTVRPQQRYNSSEPDIEAQIHTSRNTTDVFLLFNLRHPWDPKSNHIPKGNLVPSTKRTFFAEHKKTSLPGTGLVSRSRLRGTKGPHLYTTVQVLIPAGLRGACSGRSKSRNLASNRGIAFRPARANPVYATPKIFFVGFTFCISFCCCS